MKKSHPNRWQSLFRARAAASRRRPELGRIVVSRPPGLRLLSLIALLAAGCVAAYFTLGTYRPHARLAGTLEPRGGVVRIVAPQPGIVVARRVTEGARVRAGDALYSISAETNASAIGAARMLVGRQLDARIASLTAEIAATRALHTADADSLADAIRQLQRQRAAAADAVRIQSDSVRLAANALARAERAGRFLAADDVAARRAQLLEQQARLAALRGEAGSLAARLAEARAEQRSLPLRYTIRKAELERRVATTNQEIADNEARRAVDIVAPISGVATAVVADVGQAVDAARPLALIVPDAAPLEAKLLAPSSGIGFVAVGDEVRLRHAAFPYQKFGHTRGRIAAVSQSTLTPAQIGAGSAGEALYRVTVALESQFIAAYGTQHALRAGMHVEADVLQPEKRLYEWVLDPLYALSASLP